MEGWIVLLRFGGFEPPSFPDWSKWLEFCGQLGTNENYDAPVGAYLLYYPFSFIMIFVALNITVSLIMEASCPGFAVKEYRGF
jgi:hypothetical protein